MAEKEVASKQPFLVAAIDLGTTFSGWAYQYKHDYELNPLKIYAKDWNAGQNISPKTPTTVLIKPDGQTLDSFGYYAEDRYADLMAEGGHEAWFYFRRFKMKLFEEKKIELGMKIEAENGKELPALLIFSLVISSLKKSLKDHCSKHFVGGMSDDDIRWVLTVPAIWNDAAKTFMREAAIKAGIHTDRLLIALEPEAASVFCKQAALDIDSEMITGATADTFSPGTKYIVLDCGGGTIDIDAHEVLGDNKLRELHKPTGSNCGGTMVDGEFEKLLCGIFGKTVIEKLKQNHMDDFVTLFRNFEVLKRKVSEDNDSAAVLSLPFALIELCKTITGRDLKEQLVQSSVSGVSIARGNKLKIEASMMRSFYKESINDIISQLELMLHDRRLSGCKTILMVGGYSEADLLAAAIERRFPQMNIVTPTDPSLVVLKGAVMYGRNPQVIASRILKYTYGLSALGKYDPKIHPESRMSVHKVHGKIVNRMFDKIMEVGQEVLSERCYDFDGCVTKDDLEDSEIMCQFEVHASPDADPLYTDDPGVFLVGKCILDRFPDIPDMVTAVRFGLVFGGTEIEVRIKFETKSEESTMKLRLPD